MNEPMLWLPGWTINPNISSGTKLHNTHRVEGGAKQNVRIAAGKSLSGISRCGLQQVFRNLACESGRRSGSLPRDIRTLWGEKYGSVNLPQKHNDSQPWETVIFTNQEGIYFGRPRGTLTISYCKYKSPNSFKKKQKQPYYSLSYNPRNKCFH